MTALFDFIAHYGPATGVATAVVWLIVIAIRDGLPPAATITQDRAVTPPDVPHAENSARRDSPTQSEATSRLGGNRTGCAATAAPGSAPPPHRLKP